MLPLKHLLLSFYFFIFHLKKHFLKFLLSLEMGGNLSARGVNNDSCSGLDLGVGLGLRTAEWNERVRGAIMLLHLSNVRETIHRCEESTRDTE